MAVTWHRSGRAVAEVRAPVATLKVTTSSDIAQQACYEALIRGNRVVHRLLNTDVGPHQENAGVHAQPSQRPFHILDPLPQRAEIVVTPDEALSAIGSRAEFTAGSDR